MTEEIIIGVVFSLLSGLFYLRWQRAKKCLKEIAEALTTISNALEDDNLTKDELKKVAEEVGEAIAAAAAVVAPLKK